MPLPEPDRRLLAIQPVQVVLCQVRFDPRQALGDPAAGTALLDQLAPAEILTSLNPIHQQQVLFAAGPGIEAAPSVSTGAQMGWQLAARDGSWSLGVMSDQMTLETRTYPGWDRFLEVWGLSIRALAKIGAPEILTRLGLRYVNRITPAAVGTLDDLRSANLIDPSFLGPAVGSDLSEFVQGVEGRAALSFPDGTDALVHHGMASSTDPAPAFTLDIDCFRAQGGRFDMDSVLTDSVGLNDRALQIFQTVIQEPLMEELRGREVAP